MLGLAAGYPGLVTVVGVVGVLVLGWLLWRSGAGALGLALMLAGAAGNLTSRLAAGTATDFIMVRWWPGVFNLADVLLRVGALVAVVALLAESRAAGSAQRSLGPGIAPSRRT
jgi:lipoprotein signal peptidase